MADYEYITTSGVIVPNTATLQTDVEDEFQNALGADLSVDAETPQGVVITAEVLARAEVVNNNAALANQNNPNIAGGVFLESLCALTGLDVPPATFSVVPATGILLTGQPGFIIPVGSQARTAAGDIFQSTSDVTLSPSGAASVSFQALVAGPVPCASGALTTIVTEVLGWETITNVADAVPGSAVLSDDAVRNLRNQTLALQGSSLAEAITSGVAATPGVRSQKFRENKTGADATIDGIFLLKNSVWSCVDGGLDTDVAAALLNTKSGGCNWNGGTTVNVTEPASGQIYAVKFDRPTPVQVFARATVRVPGSTVTPAAAIKQAILDYAAGLVPNQAGFVVGGSVSPFELAAAVTAEIPGAYVQKMEVKSSGSFQTTEIALALNEIATIVAADITVVLL